MKIVTLLKRGTYHQNFNEDFLFHHALSDDISICAVVDGCSSAKDSHFTSSLYAKSLHKTARMLPRMKEIVEDLDLEIMSLEDIADFFMKQLFEDLKRTKKLFFLQTEELLSTIVLLIYNNKSRSALIKMNGDGLFSVNKRITEIDQNNTPNFLGYHLDSRFETVNADAIQTWSFESVTDVSISTDGIDKLLNKSKTEPPGFNVRERFLIDKPENLPENHMESLFDSFVKKGFVPHDDIGIIRLINDI